MKFYCETNLRVGACGHRPFRAKVSSLPEAIVSCYWTELPYLSLLSFFPETVSESSSPSLSFLPTWIPPPQMHAKECDG